MPRLRNTNTIITDISQICEGDCLLFRGNLWDTVGIAGRLSDGLMYICTTGCDGVTARDIPISSNKLTNSKVIKISQQTYDRILLELEAYRREGRHLMVAFKIAGFRTGLFTNA